MRLLIWGIIGLSGLAFAVQMLGVHGATNEQAAIRRAVRAPFRDLRRRDARALCDDFIPPVAAHLAATPGDCAQAIGHLFRLSAHDAEYVPAKETAAHEALHVDAISLHGPYATAAFTGPEARGQVHRWRLSLLHGRWRIASPATLRLLSDCARRPFGDPACLDRLTLRLAGPGQA